MEQKTDRLCDTGIFLVPLNALSLNTQKDRTDVIYYLSRT